MVEQGLRIQCLDTRSWIDIQRRGDLRYAWFELRCAVDIGHGHFSASNVDVQFLNGDGFVADLERFAAEPGLTPQLDGTYGSFLIFWRPGGSDELMLSFSVGDAYSLGPVTSEFNLTGSLRLPPDVLDLMIADFRNVLGGPTRL